MKLTIITINYNNASGLQKTIESVFNQSSKDFEYIVVDGGSTDSSIQLINDLMLNGERLIVKGIQVTCISEKDSGIYNAMNKGIRLAKGEFVQFLNSGDILAANNVTELMISKLKTQNSELGTVNILYGNMLKPYKGKVIHDKGFAGRKPTMLDFYTGTLNHSPAYIKRSLFDTYGLYDESLKIVSDWKWYVNVIVFNNIQPVYTDIDVTVFDMNGVSTVNSNMEKIERKQVISEILPTSVLADYEQWAFSINKMKRINRYWITLNGFLLVERILFKWEKWFKNKL